MSGALHVESPRFAAGRHDHLVLVQKKQALVFTDPRKFGRVHFYQGDGVPDWWAKLPPAVTSPEFTVDLLAAFFKRRARLAVKAALLVQTAFPGVGNWMADEILWQARAQSASALRPGSPPGSYTPCGKKAREVSRISLETIGADYSDPPDDWLIHQRWTKDGIVPSRHGVQLQTATIGGRTHSAGARSASARKGGRALQFARRTGTALLFDSSSRCS